MMGAQTFLADLVRDRANSTFGLRRLSNRRNGPSGGIASGRTGEDRPEMASPSAMILGRMPSGELGQDSILAAAEHETGGGSLEGLQDLRRASQEGVRNSLQGSNTDSVRNGRTGSQDFGQSAASAFNPRWARTQDQV